MGKQKQETQAEASESARNEIVRKRMETLAVGSAEDAASFAERVESGTDAAAERILDMSVDAPDEYDNVYGGTERLGRKGDAAERLKDTGDIDDATAALAQMFGDPEALDSEGDSEDAEGDSEGEPVEKGPTVLDLTGVKAEELSGMVRLKNKNAPDGFEEVPLRDLIRGGMRDAAYTRASQELATQRKGVQAQAAQVMERMTEVAAHLSVLEQHANTLPPQAREGIPAMRAQYAEKWNAALGTLRDLRIEQEVPRLRAAMGWTTPEEAAEGAQAIAEGARMYGLTDEDLASIVDHRGLLILHDAAQWRALQEDSTDARASLRGKRRKGVTLRPGHSGASRGDKGAKKIASAKKRARQTGTLDDSAAAIRAILGEEI